MPARNFLQHKWHAITIIVTVVVIACAALVILRGMPPHRIIMATGLEGGSYYEVGQRYRAALARESVQVELRSTSGSAENLALLLDPDSGVSVVVVPSGIAPAGSASEVAGFTSTPPKHTEALRSRTCSGRAARNIWSSCES